MTPTPSTQSSETRMVTRFKEFAKLADISLNGDHDAREDSNERIAVDLKYFPCQSYYL